MALKKHKRATIVLGTLVEVSLWLEADKDSQPFFTVAYHALREIHGLMSFHELSSDISKFRNAACGAQVEISQHTANVISFAEQLWRETAGLFDICVGDILVVNQFLPSDSAEKISADLLDKKKPSSRKPLKLTLEAGKNTLLKQSEFEAIDLGGIAKGYAVDHAIQALSAIGVPAAMINAGGDIRIFGDVIEPIHLRKNEGEFIKLCDLHNQALATSAFPTNREDVNQDIMPIVHPKKKAMLKRSAKSVSILAKDCMTADAFTKVAWLDGLTNTMNKKYGISLIIN